MNLQEIHPFFRENKRFQSNLSMGITHQQTNKNLSFEEGVSSPTISDTSDIYSEMQEDLSPIVLDSQIEFDDNGTKDEEVGSFTKQKFQTLKGKLEINKAKTRLDKVNLDAVSSTISESVTKSPQSIEKKNSKEKSMKDQWTIFKKKFFYSEKIKKYKKKVFFQ